MIRLLAISLLIATPARAAPVCVWVDQVAYRTGPTQYELCTAENDGLRELRRQDDAELKRVTRALNVCSADNGVMSWSIDRLEQQVEALSAKPKALTKPKKVAAKKRKKRSRK